MLGLLGYFSVFFQVCKLKYQRKRRASNTIKTSMMDLLWENRYLFPQKAPSRVLNRFLNTPSREEIILAFYIRSDHEKRHVKPSFSVRLVVTLHKLLSFSFPFILVNARSSRPEMFCKRVTLRTFAKFTGNTCARVSFLINLQFIACNFIKKETLAQVFSCEFC